MLKPFAYRDDRFNAVYFWLGMHADGDCSVLITLPCGSIAHYGHQHSANLFRSLYGPMDPVYLTEPHNKDADCTVDPETLICSVCLVDHSDPCPDCNGRGFHKDSCYWMSPALLTEVEA